MKILSAVVIALTITGCNDSNYVYFPVIPEGLKDCKIFNVTSNDGSKVLHVIRCPNSSTSTTYQNGSDKIHITTIEEEAKSKSNQFISDRI